LVDHGQNHIILHGDLFDVKRFSGAFCICLPPADCFTLLDGLEILEDKLLLQVVKCHAFHLFAPSVGWALQKLLSFELIMSLLLELLPLFYKLVVCSFIMMFIRVSGLWTSARNSD